ncbi:MAG: sialate O-acetylesterase [Verrucomicrobiota bacterium JB024]|nr:sialate O-acetylesterase [Verrucomicrobiota bacterium JB024]
MKIARRTTPFILTLTLLKLTACLAAEVTLPSIFSDHMVLQRELANPVWGWADPGESISVSINGQTQTTTADSDGTWRLVLSPMPAGGPYTLEVLGQSQRKTFSDVLVGEVWICSGQSNMEFRMRAINNSELEMLTANNPQIRLLAIERVGTQEPQKDIKGQWALCTPESVRNFSAIGYFFGERLERILGVPIGLIGNSWGGADALAYVPREKLEANPAFAESLEKWKAKVAAYTDDVHEKEVERYQAERKKYIANGRRGNPPQNVYDPRVGQHRPSNIYNGMVYPIIGYGIRGIIWYQGETNAGRAVEYQQLFPLVINNMREDWGQGDFPFYWIQLADFRAEDDEPSDSTWAELRESQTMTMNSVPNTGQAVIIDVGESFEIHPLNKRVPADRLVCWALANDYGFTDIPYESPQFESMEIEDGKVHVYFYPVNKGLYPYDSKEVKGFAIAGSDGKFVWANAKIVANDEVLVWSDEVAEPVAIRYAWGSNPIANLYDGHGGLPVTPFRTDNGILSSSAEE